MMRGLEEAVLSFQQVGWQIIATEIVRVNMLSNHNGPGRRTDRDAIF